MESTVGKLRYLLTRREQMHAVLLLVFMLIGAGLEMLGVGAIPAFVALLSDPERVLQHTAARALVDAFPSRSAGSLALYSAAGLLVFFIVKNSYLATLSFIQARYVTNRQVGIACRLFRAYLHSPYSFHLQRNTAELVRNTNTAALDVVGGVLIPGLSLSMELMTVGAILLLLLLTEPLISLVAFLVLGGATLLFVRVIRKRLLRYGQQMQHYSAKMIQAVNEGLGGVKITKVLGREQHFLRAFATQADGFAEAGRFRQIMVELPRLFLEMAAIVGLLGVAALLLAERRPVQAIIPTLSLLAVAVVRMIPSFNRITSSLTTLRYGRFALEVVHADLRQLERAASPDPDGGPAAPLSLTQRICLENVHYCYPGAAEPSLRGVTLEIRKGSAVGFVGPTGAGKTTVVDVILGLLEPSQGRILIDGQNLRDNLRSWQRQIGYVPQDVYLIDDTIRRNIGFGLSDDEIDEEAVRRAIEAAQLGGFVSTLPNGIDTIVGERGVRLSGGQRQRIGIARALYHDPEVLILDEATSSLDNETERYVMQAVEHLRGRRTIIIVAHRMTTVRGCDRLFLLEDGCLLGSGAYGELLDESQYFRLLASADQQVITDNHRTGAKMPV